MQGRRIKKTELMRKHDEKENMIVGFKRETEEGKGEVCVICLIEYEGNMFVMREKYKY